MTTVYDMFSANVCMPFYENMQERTLRKNKNVLNPMRALTNM